MLVIQEKYPAFMNYVGRVENKFCGAHDRTLLISTKYIPNIKNITHCLLATS